MDNMCVIVFTSPIPAHPSTELIEDVIASIRFQLPNIRIIIACDGVREQVKHREAQYEQYKNNLDELRLNTWKNVEIVEFGKATQQVGMLKHILFHNVKEDLVFVIEHDCVLTKDYIDWNAIKASIHCNFYNTVRLYWMDKIHPEHFYLTQGSEITMGAEFLRTTQFSGWVNVFRTSYISELLEKLDKGKPEMIETLVYGPIVNADWEDNKMVIYYPHENGQPNATRFRHMDGRQGIGDKKGDDKEW